MGKDLLKPIPSSASLSPNTPESISAIERVTEAFLATPQLELMTEHVLHGGMYARTIRMPAGYALAGALIKIPTILIINGDAGVWGNDGWRRVQGYTVLAGSAGRKMLCFCKSAVEMTMIFPTKAKTVDEAEREFTDDWERLVSRKSTSDIFIITGEQP